MMDASGQDVTVSERCRDQSTEDRDQSAEGKEMDAEIVVTGAIIDSWVEPPGAAGDHFRLVLQVAPKGRPKDLMIVEAEASLVPDCGLLEDLGENLCHGSPVAAVGRLTHRGFFSASQLRLAR
jgi:hypothetical protein